MTEEVTDDRTMVVSITLPEELKYSVSDIYLEIRDTLNGKFDGYGITSSGGSVGMEPEQFNIVIEKD